MDNVKIFFIAAIVLLLYFAATWTVPHGVSIARGPRIIELLKSHPVWYSTTRGALMTLRISNIVQPLAESGASAGVPGTLMITLTARDLHMEDTQTWSISGDRVSLQKGIIIEYQNDSKLTLLGVDKLNLFDVFYPGTSAQAFITEHSLMGPADIIIGASEYVKKMLSGTPQVAPTQVIS